MYIYIASCGFLYIVAMTWQMEAQSRDVPLLLSNDFIRVLYGVQCHRQHGIGLLHKFRAVYMHRHAMTNIQSEYTLDQALG